MNLGENIKTARKAAGVTQKELAERLQVYQKDISPPPIRNITQTQSRVKSMLLKLGVFLVAVGLVKLLVAFILRAREKRGKA